MSRLQNTVRELWTRGSPPPEAIVGGISSSAGVVTSAALIMVALFSIFATLPQARRPSYTRHSLASPSKDALHMEESDQ